LRVDKEAKNNQTIFRYIHLNFHSHHWHEPKFFTAIIQKKTHQYPDSVGASAKTYLQTRRSSGFYPVSGFSFIQPQKQPRTTLLIFQKKQTPNNSP
jgi:hypothetical protein